MAGSAPSLGFDSDGGLALVVDGKVERISNLTDEKTGEVSTLVNLVYMGGNKYIRCSPGSPVALLREGERATVLVPSAVGKKGIYSRGEPRLLSPSTNGKA